MQLWYGDNDQMKNAAVGNLYENLQINPLAGCLPALAQIPIFLGVYYSVTSIAKAAIIQVRRRVRGRGWGLGRGWG